GARRIVTTAGPSLRLLEQGKPQLHELELHLAHLAAQQVGALGQVLHSLRAREQPRLRAQDHGQPEAEDADGHQHLEQGEAPHTSSAPLGHQKSSLSEYSPSMRGSGKPTRPRVTAARPVSALTLTVNPSSAGEPE